MEGFSAALKLADLNDFIAPSQACVVSLNNKIKPNNDSSEDDGTIKIHSRIPLKTLNRPPDEPVKVTLHDCLACSGCITSAETVMLQQQSTDEFLNELSRGDKQVIVSLSPQSRASFATFYGISQLQVFKKLTTFFKSLGVKAVFDTSCSRDLSLVESCCEFISRFNEHNQANLPILTSACPGWICYAEKTLDADILPHISKVKSPQQAMGSIIKRHICSSMGLRPEDVYHVTVMPCYDKKLEASRDDFIFGITQGLNLTEVDSVLTSGEILDLLQSRNVDFVSLEEQPLDRLLTNVNEEGHLYGVPGGSGGYAEIVFKHAAKQLFGKELSERVEFQIIRNTDFREVKLEVDGLVRLRFACAYGFRNIQNIIRKIRMKKCEYQYVEIMACPAGCLNGGGQIKPRKGQTQKELIQTLESNYLKEVDMESPFENPTVRGLYESWLGEPASEIAKQVMHTDYHYREKSLTNQLSNW